EGGIEFSVFLGHGDSSMDIVSPIEVSGVIRPAHALTHETNARNIANPPKVKHVFLPAPAGLFV
ncbi:hypothetical protein KDX30_28955, partial [Pseudomonas sp. CDFA 553]|uniref:hypothetical protein n=1 Tax=Pseudomonas quasicaspiana TaxID=2829821 RepID=UPI001E362834